MLHLATAGVGIDDVSGTDQLGAVLKQPAHPVIVAGLLVIS